MRVDEQALLNQVKRGNVQAFSALVNMYRERVLRLAFHLVGSYEDAEDVAQETFVRAYFSMNKYDPTRPFAPWIYRIATNLCMDNLRRRKARPQQVELPPHMELFNSEEEKESPEELICAMKPTLRCLMPYRSFRKTTEPFWFCAISRTYLIRRSPRYSAPPKQTSRCASPEPDSACESG